MQTIGYYSYQNYFLHDVGDDHPEHPFRILAIESRLQDSPVVEFLEYNNGSYASQLDILRAHTSGYIEQLHQITPEHGSIMMDRDTPLSSGSLQAAYEACGTVTTALGDIMSGKYRHAFCAVRPPGHHAEKKKGMGFCFINHVAVAALKAIEEFSAKRVLVVDFDVHQANGTIDILADRNDCMVITSFQHPFFPFSHWQQDEHANVINTPLKSGTGSDEFRKAVKEQWLQQIKYYQPDLLVVSAGFDAHQKDPTAELNLDATDYYWIARELMGCIPNNTPVLSVLEGGYHLGALADSVEQYLLGLLP